MNVSLESCVISNYVKYERLSPLIAEAYKGCNDSYLDIYIDMNTIINLIYSKEKYSPSLGNYKSLTPCILNMCAHYKNYFKKYLGVNTSIYIVTSNNCNEINSKFVAEYNINFKKKMKRNETATKLINDNIQLMNKIVPYLQNIYLIESTFETCATIAGIIEKRQLDGNINANLIISRDILNTQLVYMYNKTALLRPAKDINGNDISYIFGISENMPIDIYWKLFEKSLGKDIKDNTIIHPSNVPLLLAMCGYKKRSLNKLININNAKKYIHNCIGDNPVQCSVKTLYEVNNQLQNKVSWTVIDSRFKTLDLAFQKALYQDSIEYRLLNFVDLYDPNTIKKINDSLFYDNPIDIERL